MILYHGSKKLLKQLKAQQATSSDPQSVPEGELLNAIYFTPDFKFSIAMAARPEGLTEIDDDRITFENPALFNPEEDIYIYELESKNIKPENLKKIDSKQYTVIGIGSLQDLAFQKLKAKELFKYYELVNYKEPGSKADKR